MSSAEDTSSSTVSAPAGSSHSAPEEFPVEPHQEQTDEHSSSAPLPEGPNPVQLSETTSPEQSPPEPGEEAAGPLKTKPLPRVNAVAREARVRVTGARPVNLTGERELFTESTTTVLVFEKGAVIHLTAAATPGQLLFLTNEESKREVVTQVTRKRTFRPTECYAELEFIESAPGFWGMEFSAATALLPKDAKVIAALELIATAETTDDELDEAAPPPSADEVQALKKEVDALRGQLNLLQAQPEPPAAAIPDTAAVPATEVVPKAEATSAPAEPALSFAHTPESSPIETAPEHKWISAAGEEFLQKPTMDFHIPVPKRKRSFRARGQFTPGFRTGMLRLTVLSMILAALVGTAWYKHWLPWMQEQESKKISVSSWAGSVTTAAPVPEVRPASPSPAAVGVPQVKSGNDIPPSSAPAAESSQPPALPDKTPSETATGNKNEKDMGSSLPTVATVAKGKRAAREKKVPPVLMAKSLPPPALPAKMVNSNPVSASNSILVPPKLIKSRRAVASLDDLRDFETGSVVIDAIIDTAGDVTSPNVLSGPPSLRRPALEALKNYKYEPATQNGKPVPAHVTVKIQFHFE